MVWVKDKKQDKDQGKKANPLSISNKTTNKYSKEFDQLIIDHGTTGGDALGFCGLIGITKDTFDDWKKKYPSFSKAAEIAEHKAYYYWELLNRKSGVDSNASVIKFNMVNRFGWSTEDDFKRKIKNLKDELTVARNKGKKGKIIQIDV